MYTKSGLAIELSRLAAFEKADIRLEQYPTDSEIAAEILWFAYMNGDIKGKLIADLGCGAGILGIGALLLGARFVYFVDADKKALNALVQNLASFHMDRTSYQIINKQMQDFNVTNKTNKNSQENKNIDIVIQNPPFGTKKQHADRQFLEKAFALSPKIYSFHKSSTRSFIKAIAETHKFTSKLIKEFNFPIKAGYKFHKQRIHRVKVDCWLFEKLMN